MPKGNEDLKAKIAKIQQKGKQGMPAPAVQEEPMQEQPEEDSMEALNAEFEARKKALLEKSNAERQQTEQAMNDEGSDEAFEKAMTAYSDDGKFRVELVYQWAKTNDSLKRIADALEKVVNN